MPRRRPRNGNRSDLTVQPIRTATGQGYGEATAQRQAQKVIPLPKQTVPDLSRVVEAATNAPIPTGLLDGASDTPDEPVTAGLPFGPGPGPESLAFGATDPVEAGLRALYEAYPNEALRRLLEIRTPGTGSLPNVASGTPREPGTLPPSPPQ